MKELFFFIKNGYSISNDKLDNRTLVKFLIIYFAFSIILGIIVAFIIKVFGITHKTLHLSSIYKTILVGIFLAPIYEEIFFRSLLIFNKKTILLFITNSLILILITYYYSKITYMVIILSFTLFFLSILFIYDIVSIQTFVKSHIAKLYFISSILFGIMHIFNFSGNLIYLILFGVLLAGPQIFLGFILGYIRIKNGLIYSIIFHVLVNSMLIFTVINK